MTMNEEDLPQKKLSEEKTKKTLSMLDE